MSREEFIKALNTAATREFADVPDEDSIEWDFSESFLRKMQKLIRDCRRPYLRLVNTASKRAAAVAAVLLTLFAAGFGIKAVREPIVRIIKEAYRTFIGYSFEGDVEDEIVSFCYPQFIPEGFEQSDVLETETVLRVKFENDSNKMILDEIREEYSIFLSRCSLEEDLDEVIHDQMVRYLPEADGDPIGYLQDAKNNNMVKLVEKLTSEDCQTIYNHSITS